MRSYSAMFLCFTVACGPAVFAPAVAPRVIPAPFVPEDDVEFVDAMTWHHAAAIEMAAEVSARGEDEALIALSGEISRQQQDEIHAMDAVRASLTHAPTTLVAPDPHQEDDLARIGSLTGHALDVAFLEAMIPHHGEGLGLAHRSLPQLDSLELRDMAEDMVTIQAREIGELQALLDALTLQD